MPRASASRVTPDQNTPRTATWQRTNGIAPSQSYVVCAAASAAVVAMDSASRAELWIMQRRLTAPRPGYRHRSATERHGSVKADVPLGTRDAPTAAGGCDQLRGTNR